MKYFLLGTHGKMASGIKGSLDILLGGSDSLTVIDAYIDEKDVKTEIENYFSKVNDDDQVIMLSDIAGGSVNQVMFQFLNRPNTFLVSGVNLPLILELVIDTDTILTQDDLNHLIENAKSGLKIIEFQQDEEEEDEFF